MADYFRFARNPGGTRSIYNLLATRHWASKRRECVSLASWWVEYNSSSMNASASEGKPASDKSKRVAATLGLVAVGALSLMVGVEQEPERFDVISVRPHKAGDQNFKPPVFQPGGRFLAAAPGRSDGCSWLARQLRVKPDIAIIPKLPKSGDANPRLRTRRVFKIVGRAVPTELAQPRTCYAN